MTSSQLEALITDVECHLQRLRHERLSSSIGRHVLDRLQEVDEVAYVRFASVYREFTDVRQFITELEYLHRGLGPTTDTPPSE